MGCFVDGPPGTVERIASVEIAEANLEHCASAATASNTSHFAVTFPLSRDIMQCWYPATHTMQAATMKRLQDPTRLMPDEQCIGSWDMPSYYAQEFNYSGGLFRAAVYTFEDP